MKRKAQVNRQTVADLRLCVKRLSEALDRSEERRVGKECRL